MANSTFNGPVRSEGGFEQITVTAKTGAVTNNFDIDSNYRRYKNANVS